MIAAIAVLVLGLIGWWAVRRGQELMLRHRLEARVHAALVEANAAARSAHDEAIRAGEEAATPQFAAADAGAEVAVAELTSFTGCFKLVFKMVGDACHGGRTAYTDTYIETVIAAPVLSPFAGGCRDLDGSLDQLRDRLGGNSVQLAVRLAAVMEPERQDLRPVLQGKLAGLAKAVHAQAPRVRAIATGTTVGIVGLAVSAVCIKATWTAVRTVTTAIARRMLVASGLAVGAAAIDGPFPLGDCIAVVIEVVGTAWCVYDLVQARYTLKGELDSALHQQVRESCREALASFHSEADGMLAATLQQNQVLAAAAVAAIRK